MVGRYSNEYSSRSTRKAPHQAPANTLTSGWRREGLIAVLWGSRGRGFESRRPDRICGPPNQQNTLISGPLARDLSTDAVMSPQGAGDHRGTITSRTKDRHDYDHEH